MKSNRLKNHFVGPLLRSPCCGRARLGRVLLLLTSLLPLAMAAITSAQTTYTVTDIGTFGGALTSATGINSSGDVVGFSGTPTGDHAFLWHNGTMTDLGTLGGSCCSTAYGINDSGTVVGVSGAYSDTPFVYTSNSGMVRLGPFYPLTLNEVDAINGTGQIVGQGQDFNVPCAQFVAMIYYNGTVQRLASTECGDSWAVAVNASGQAAGFTYDFDPNNRHACLYSGGHVTDLGTLPGWSSSEATGINNSGQIVGFGVTASYDQRGFIYSTGTMTDLGTLGAPGGYSHAYGINNAGQVVGESDGRAFIYTPSGGMVNLNSVITNLAGSGFTTLIQARTINNSGQIAGYGDFSDGNEHAFLLTPTASHPAFFTGETALGGGFYYLQFANGTPFGYYSYLSNQNFIYHIDLGFEYLFDANDVNHAIYFYDFASSSFFYTSPTLFPDFYDFSLNAWLYYLPDANNPARYTHNPRWFFNFATGQWITL